MDEKTKGQSPRTRLMKKLDQMANKSIDGA